MDQGASQSPRKGPEPGKVKLVLLKILVGMTQVLPYQRKGAARSVF